MEKVELKKIEILTKELTNKLKGNKFTAYRAVQKNGKLIDCKFRKDVDNKPTEHSVIEVYANQMNIDRSKKYPVLWIKKIETVKKFEELVGDDSITMKQVNEMF